MAAPNTSNVKVTLTPPYTAGQDTQLVAIPAGYALAGFDFSCPDLDTGTTPTLALDFGTVQNGTDLAAANTIGRTGGALVLRGFTPKRYAAAGWVWMNVATAAATSVAATVTSTAYIYRAVSRVELRDRVLRKLGVVAADNPPSADDARIALEALEALHARLEGMTLTRWGDPGASSAATEDAALASFGPIVWDLDCVPAFAALQYGIMAASDLADDFGLDSGRIGRLLQEAAGAERELRRMARIPSNGDPVAVEFY